MKSKKILAVITVSCLPVLANAASDIPFVFSAGDPARASDVNENFEYLINKADELADTIGASSVSQADMASEISTLGDTVTLLRTEQVALDGIVNTNKENITSINSSIVLVNNELLVANNNAQNAQSSALAALAGVNDLSGNVNTLTTSVASIEGFVPAVNESIEVLIEDLQVANNNIVSTNTSLESVRTEIVNNKLIYDQFVDASQDQAVIVNENMQEIGQVKTKLEELTTEVFDISVGDVCDGDRLSNTGKNVTDFTHVKTGVIAGDVVQLNGEDLTVFTLPYWNDQTDQTYTITLPLGKFSVYTSNDVFTPCVNAEIDDYVSRLRLKTNVDYNYNVGEVDAVITSTINAQIKAAFTIFDISYSVSTTVPLGDYLETSTHDIMTYVKDVKLAHDDTLINMLNNVSIEGPPF